MNYYDTHHKITIYYCDGTIMEECFYLNKKKRPNWWRAKELYEDGECKVYYRDGTLEEQYYYEMGVVKE